MHYWWQWWLLCTVAILEEAGEKEIKETDQIKQQMNMKDPSCSLHVQYAHHDFLSLHVYVPTQNICIM